MVCEGFDAGSVSKIEAVDLESIDPVGRIVFGVESCGGIAWKPGGDDDMASGLQQLQRGMKADLDAASGQDRVPPRQVGGSLSAFPVELGTIAAEGIVEEVDLVEVSFADVATAWDIETIDELLVVKLIDLGQLGIERFGRAGFLELARTGLGADSGPSQLVFVSGFSFGEFGLFPVFVLAT